ncbi:MULTISPECIES: hypothetical protein [unclassified Aureimonas]|uniref:hypothetical protein n=1 Tax=unclassified Aureimonas TaxID=2615206 RepID=UPI0006F6D298|nr:MULTISPECIES: hypothetical protein [unclassified Aureimonas]KQT64407.1 hypothetical protein ASG62_05425 [Aureimonas sp. Leaf427]KQT81597.1 hypothetical protein ASG54_02705 [Aureimonas sp. Leaf460]
MKLSILAAAAAVLLFGTAARAETLLFPSDEPVASITFPGTWQATENESGIEGFSPDETISFYVDVATDKTSDKIVEDGIDFLAENGVTLKEGSMTESKSTVNGMEMEVIGWEGTDAAGPASIVLAFLAPAPDKILMITYWGTQGEEQKYGAEVDSIVNSIKPAR